jgi:predicted O-linked N-acetylglucosamine transferase (SPINDLY family)
MPDLMSAPDHTIGEDDPVALLRHAIGLEERGDRASARSLMHQIAEQRPEWDEPWVRIGQSWRQAGDSARAAAAYDIALTRNPDRPEALLARGLLALGNQPPQDAVDLLTRATNAAPAHDQAWHALAYAYVAHGRPDLAVDALVTAGRLAPDSYVYASDLADLLERSDVQPPAETVVWSDRVVLACAARRALQRGALDEAIDGFEAALALRDDDVVILKQLAAVYLTAQQPEHAEPLLREAIRLAPDDMTTLNDFAVTLGRLYRFGEAEAVLRACGEDAAITSQMLFNRATLRASIGDFEGAARDIEIAKGGAVDDAAALQSECALLPYRSSITAATLRDAMIALGRALPTGDAPLFRHPAPLEADRGRPLRIGLLSNALRRHPVAWLTFAGLKALDPAVFSLHCFGHYDPEDCFAPDFARHVAAWHNIDGIGDAAVAGMIAAADIDVLIDLSGFGDGGRTPVTAFQPAPVQIKWVGSQASTTGVPAIDWMITDRWETPDGYEAFYTERLLRLPDGYVCYMPPPNAPAVSPLPATVNGHITFGCFNNLAKLTDETLRLWQRVLEAVPDARLALRCPQFSEPSVSEHFMARATSIGLDPARLSLQGRASHAAFIAGYRDVDIALDPHPYSGGLTTCEALFMGVPVVTLAGDFFAARHSVSHLSNVGMVGCIAQSEAEYVALAVSMAADRAGLAAVRAGLRQRVLASPLCDAPRFGRNLGAALRFAWQAYCDQACQDRNGNA